MARRICSASTSISANGIPKKRSNSSASRSSRQVGLLVSTSMPTMLAARTAMMSAAQSVWMRHWGSERSAKTSDANSPSGAFPVSRYSIRRATAAFGSGRRPTDAIADWFEVELQGLDCQDEVGSAVLLENDGRIDFRTPVAVQRHLAVLVDRTLRRAHSVQAFARSCQQRDTSRIGYLVLACDVLIEPRTRFLEVAWCSRSLSFQRHIGNSVL